MKFIIMRDICECHIQDCKILPEREDLLSFLKKKIMYHEVHGQVHECLVKIMDTFPARSHTCHIFNHPKEYEEDLRGHHQLYGSEMLVVSHHEEHATRQEVSGKKHSYEGKGERMM
jgi:hypothetical protein